jgi:hypothetical protein
MRDNLVSSKQMILHNVYGKELGQFSSKEVAGMLFCSQYAKNYRMLLTNGQGLRLNAIQFGRAMKEARGRLVKTNRIVNKILEERPIAARGFWFRLSALVFAKQKRR